ncbi:MAG: TonB-dependent receptor [Phenylobacterium sp.]|nr:MAG: TonB-dependent receptor [Phenylobacterium sp.]
MTRGWVVMIKRHKPTAAAFAAALLAGCATPALAWAAEADADAAGPNVSEVLVKGKRADMGSVKAVEAVEYGNSVQVVTAADVAKSGAVNFAELAQFLVKGVNVGYSPDEGEYTIRLDGGGDRDTLVVRDGVPLYDRGPALEDIWGTTTIDPHMIERVEVFRGGNSLFFGSNGGIGVISLVTKKPDGTRKGELGVSYGSFESREIWGNYSFPIDADGRHSVMFYGSMQATDGPRIFNPDDFVDNVRAAGGVQEYPLNRNEVGVKYLWKIDDSTEFRLNGEYTESQFQDAFPDREVHSPNTVRYPIIDGSLEKRWSPMLLTEVNGYYSNPKLWNTELYPDICLVQAGCVNPATNARVPFGAWSGKVFANGANRGFGSTNQRRAGFKEYGLTVRNTVNLGEYLEFVVGGQVVRYQDDSAAEYPVDNDPATTKGVFIDARPRLPFSPDTAISLAVRTDFLPGSEKRTIWKFGVRQPLPYGFYVRANGGTSYSLPRITELRNDTSTVVGNPNLQTEETETYNGGFGYERRFDGFAVSAEVGGFKTEITNRIRTTTDFPIPAGNGFPSRNTYYNDPAITRILGVTADINLNVGESWRINLGYTAQDAAAKTGVLKGEQIGETPAWFISGMLEWTSPDRRLNVAVMPRLQGSEFASGGLTVNGVPQIRKNFGKYTVTNATVNYFLGDDLQYQLQFRVVNVFNEKYAERYGFGNQLYGSAFNRGEYTNRDPRYFFGYPFEGKPRAFYGTFTARF